MDTPRFEFAPPRPSERGSGSSLLHLPPDVHEYMLSFLKAGEECDVLTEQGRKCRYQDYFKSSDLPQRVKSCRSYCLEEKLCEKWMTDILSVTPKVVEVKIDDEIKGLIIDIFSISVTVGIERWDKRANDTWELFIYPWIEQDAINLHAELMGSLLPVYTMLTSAELAGRICRFLRVSKERIEFDIATVENRRLKKIKEKEKLRVSFPEFVSNDLRWIGLNNRWKVYGSLYRIGLRMKFPLLTKFEEEALSASV